jgi:PAS domain S-box-containing protein
VGDHVGIFPRRDGVARYMIPVAETACAPSGRMGADAMIEKSGPSGSADGVPAAPTVPPGGTQGEPLGAEAAAMYRAAIETSADGFWLSDAHGRILEVNDAYLKRSGYSREELLSLRICDIDALEDPAETAAHIDKIIREGSDLFETQHRAKDGTLWPVEVNSSHWPIAGGRNFNFLRDITRRKRSEALLRTRFELSELAERGTVEALLQHALDAAELLTGSSIGFFHFVDADQESLTLQNWSTNTLRRCTAAGSGKHLPISRAGVWAACFRAKAPVIHNDYAALPGRRFLPPGHAPVTREVVVPISRDGKIVAIAGVGNKTSDYLQDDVDTLRQVASLVMDLVTRMRAEQELRNYDVRLRDAQRLARLGSWRYDVRGAKLWWSDELYQIFGIRREAGPITMERFLALVHPDDRAALEAQIAAEAPHRSEYRVVLPDGTLTHIHEEIQVLRDEDGALCGFAGTAQDITDRKNAEKAIRESEERFRQSEEFIRGILDTVDEGFIVVDPSYRILTANKAYCDQAGRTAAEIVGRNCFAISHSSSRPCYEAGEECAVRQVFATGAPHAAFHKHPGPGGHLLYVETKAFPIKDAEGAVTSVIETVNNITEKHLLEEERLKTQKLESIGTLAGGIAHDFNNLLQGIFGYIAMAKLTYDQKERSLAMLEEAEKALHQSVNLTTQLLTFSKGGKPVMKRMALDPVIEGSAKFALSGSRTEYQLDFEPGLWQVNGDAGQLGQVIQNVVLNADQAMPLGGVVKITARNVAAGDPSLPATLAHGAYVAVSIEDNGVGIPESSLPRIFDPYFTTKEKGSGLGLATSYSIVSNHGGRIVVTSAAGKGSRFELYFPAVSSGPAAAAERQAPSPAAPKARILVMDDEEMIRNLAGELLGALGHQVGLAAHGEAALTLYQEAAAAGRPFDLVILDLTIRGGLGGAETFQRLRAIDPNVKAVVSSGYSDDPAVAVYRQQGFAAFLKKPYKIGDLQALLSTLLTS